MTLALEYDPVLATNVGSHTDHLPWRTPGTPNVLIIEDDQDLQEGWSVFLRHHGYDVSASLDGSTGLEAIEQTVPDVVLLDLGLPGMHGFKVLHEVRMRGHDVKVIVVTAESSPKNDVRALRQGAARVLQKPVNPHTLVAAIDRLLND